MSASIPLGDADVFRGRSRLVRRTRLGLALGLLAVTIVALLAALRLHPTATPLLPADASGIVVLDVSASISSDTYARISTTLDRLARSNGRYGLVLFSDTAYQALPPNTPARELRPFRRFFDVPRRTSPGGLPELPRSPWADSFSGGTRISTGLELALAVIRADDLSRPAVLLVSDLDDDTADLDRVSRVAVAYRRAGIPLHVVGLNPAPEDAAFISRLVPGRGNFTRATLPGERGSSVGGSTNRTLVAAGVLVAFGLAGFVVVSRRLRWEAGS